uniref:SCP domain-containing protein n=1 Tax=Fagus sylvatica TaxID=28930 RepID=A0A2N9GP97_FAGSY
MLQVRILLSIILSISLFFLGVSAQQNPNTILNKRLGRRFNPNANANGNGNMNITPPSFQGPLAHKKKKHHHKALSKEFLSAHNKIRRLYNEPPLKWDRKLARYARRWASKRFLDCRMVHSYGPYGENLFWGKHDHWTPAQAVQSWADEHQFYDPMKRECVQGQMCGHYTQVVWRDTTHVGCSSINCQDGGMYVICVYDPPGNYVNESPFDTSMRKF